VYFWKFLSETKNVQAATLEENFLILASVHVNSNRKMNYLDDRFILLYLSLFNYFALNLFDTRYKF